ncbi:MAG: hypothetical protein QOJ25_1515 [Solirubrobacteraceae bacterium]|jgi:hypothetical protein|nr:hypothetical protein [Solirubrobacteraceae bacterium]
MDGERSHDRTEPSQRSVESAVLAIAIERHPEPLAQSDLLDEMTAVARNPGRTAEVEDAITGLIEVGLLVQADDAFCVTPASLRAGELELGL